MKKQKCAINKQTGFTLIEVLVAMVIFTIGILSTYSMQIISSKGNTVANRLTESTQEASDYVEEVLAENFGFITGDGSVGDISWVLEQDAPKVGIKTIHVTIIKQGWGGAKPITISYVKADI